MIGSKLDEHALESFRDRIKHMINKCRFDAKPKRNTDIDCYRKETDTVH